MIQYGDADAVITGGSEAALTPLSKAAFARLDAVSPTGISRPFDARRDGFVMGEGGAVLVLEDAEKAAERGAEVLATVRGFGATSDAHHLTAPHPEGAGAAAAIRRALRGLGHQARGRQLHQRPRHLDAAQRPRRDQGDQGKPSATTRPTCRCRRPSPRSATCWEPRERSR